MDNYQPPVRYIDRTREYYEKLGFATPYHWAQFDDTPFKSLSVKPENATVGLITTAAPYDPRHGDQGPGAPYNGGAKFYSTYTLPVDGPLDLRISHIAYDRVHTEAKDMNSYFPIDALRIARNDGRVGRLGDTLVGLPTDRSQRITMNEYAPEIFAIAKRDAWDAVFLYPT